MSRSAHASERARFTSLAHLVADLPEELWTAGSVRSEIWDAALLEPARDILSRSGKGVRGRVVGLAWRLAGGDPGGAPDELCAAIELLHVGSLVVDDIEDDSRTRRGGPTVHRRYGVPKALNMGNWLYFLSMGLLSRLPVPADVRVALVGDTIDALLRCHQGQALDLEVRVVREPRAAVTGIVTTSTTLKTGALMELAARMGARPAGADGDDLERIASFGREIGVALQMLDDWSGIAVPARREKGTEDVRLQRPTWPWAWLAALGDEIAYADLAHQARRASTEWEASRVAEGLRSALAEKAPVRIREQVERALARLPRNVDPEAVAEARTELDALVRAYG